MKRRDGNVDRLSGLPDDVLYHILSFLQTNHAVCTSVLAKRWKFLWTYVPNLEFFGYPIRSCRTPQNLDIINRVVMLHNARTVNTFRLSRVKGRAHRLETLIIYPIKRRVQNLFLEFGYKYGNDIVCTVPRLLFTCKTLVDLKLVNCGRIPSSGEIFMPNLKKLNLFYVEYESDESLPHLLSGCPVLEELAIDDVFREEQKNSGCIIVSSPTIKTLNVCFYSRSEQDLDEMLIIDVPALVYLKVDRCDLDSIKSLRTMNSLIEAEIILYGYWHRCGIDCTVHGRATEFFSCLCDVKCLKITSDFEESLFDIVGTGPMPKFVNLTKLELRLVFDWHHLVKFLEVADNLEAIVFNSSWMPYKEPRQVPTCMLSCLRTVKMTYFVYDPEVFCMLRYILKNAQVLERMEIYADYDYYDKLKYLDACRRISSFDRASKSCQFVFE